MRLIHLPVVKIDIPVRTAYNKAIAAAAPEMKMTAQRQKCRDSPYQLALKSPHHKVVESKGKKCLQIRNVI